MHALDKKLAVIDRAPAVFQINSAETNRFYLCADKLDACFKAFKDKIFMACLTVFGNCFSTLERIFSSPFKLIIHQSDQFVNSQKIGKIEAKRGNPEEKRCRKKNRIIRRNGKYGFINVKVIPNQDFMQSRQAWGLWSNGLNNVNLLWFQASAWTVNIFGMRFCCGQQNSYRRFLSWNPRNRPRN